MAIKSHKTIEQIAESETSVFSNIMKRIALIKKMDNAIKKLLPPEVAAHCQVANYRNGQIILEIQNSAIATLVRFQLPNLLTHLRQNPDYAGITAINYYIKPKERKHKPHLPSAKRNLSEHNAQYLREVASGIDDPIIKKILLSLTKHANHSQK